MNPRTFLKPARPQASPLPEKGVAMPPSDDAMTGPGVFAFLRHTGCPFAEATMRSLSEFSEANPRLSCVAISHATPQETVKWCEAVGRAESVRVVDDPEGLLYAKWGLGLTPLRHWGGRQSLSAVMRLAKQGIRNRHPSGSRWQSAGTFAVDASDKLAWMHVPRHAGDLPDFAEALQALKNPTN